MNHPHLITYIANCYLPKQGTENAQYAVQIAADKVAKLESLEYGVIDYIEGDIKEVLGEPVQINFITKLEFTAQQSVKYIPRDCSTVNALKAEVSHLFSTTRNNRDSHRKGADFKLRL